MFLMLPRSYNLYSHDVIIEDYFTLLSLKFSLGGMLVFLILKTLGVAH